MSNEVLLQHLDRLKRVLTEQQIGQLVTVVENAHERAGLRKSGQTAHVYFNENGHPTVFGATDNMRGIAPGKVAPLE